jgi:hypothetical protein
MIGRRYLVLTSILLAFVDSTRATSADQCIEFDQIPIRITSAGCYLLRNDITVSDLHADAITVGVSDVQIDLNNHEIRNLSGPATRSSGVYANSIQNVSIKNGRISGFLYAVRVDGGSTGVDSANIKIEGVVASGNYFRGISVEATKAYVAENRVFDTGGSTLFEDAFAMAVEIKGNSCVVERNYIDGIYPVGIGEGVGISLSNSRNDCRVINNYINSGDTGNGTFGIWLVNEDVRGEVAYNHVIGFNFPFSIPRLPGIWRTITNKTRILKNTLENIKCSNLSYSSYYDGLSSDNEFLGEFAGCPVLIDSRRASYLRNRADPRATFQFAESMYWCASEHKLSDDVCCKLKRESIFYYEKAAELGLAEALRILPRVRKSVITSPVCLRCNYVDSEESKAPAGQGRRD